MKKYGRVMLRPFRASVPHASVMPCLGFEALIIKQVIRVYSRNGASRERTEYGNFGGVLKVLS
jgi:hypothetical protein